MLFVSFQPNDWRTCARKKNQVYSSKLNFDPMYCIPAEHLDICLINAMMIEPVRPECAIFFKTNRFYMVSKLEHYQWLENRSRKEPMCFDSKIINRDFIHGNIGEYLSKNHPFNFEYLVDASCVNVIAEIDIIKTLNAVFIEECTMDEVSKQVDKHVHEDVKWYEKESKPQDMVQIMRNSKAQCYFPWYVCENDLFINDYKKIIGERCNDKCVTTEHIDAETYCELYGAFSDNPNKQNYEKCIQYIIDKIYL